MAKSAKCREHECAHHRLAICADDRLTTDRLETRKLSKLGAVRPMMMA
jgi:hypothetical protein